MQTWAQALAQGDSEGEDVPQQEVTKYGNVEMWKRDCNRVRHRGMQEMTGRGDGDKG